MHNDGPCMRQTFLPLIDLVQEAEDTPRLAGDTVVRPAQVLVVPDLPHQVPLDRVQESVFPAPTHGSIPPKPDKRTCLRRARKGTAVGDTHIVQRGDL